MSNEIKLRKLEPADLPQVVRVHLSSFPDSALSKLGAEVVRLYYLWQLDGPHEKVQATGAFAGNDCVGFSFSGIFNGSTSGFINQNKTALIVNSLMRPWLIFNPLFFKRLREGVKLLRRFTRKKTASADGGKKTKQQIYGILSIAVAGNCQKAGIGQMLMRDAEEEAVKYGYESICLTVHPENIKAVKFYEKQNWQRFRQSDLWDGAMIKLLK